MPSLDLFQVSSILRVTRVRCTTDKAPPFASHWHIDWGGKSDEAHALYKAHNPTEAQADYSFSVLNWLMSVYFKAQ